MDLDKHSMSFGSGSVGYPSVVCIDRDRCLVADSRGNLWHCDLGTKQVTAHTYGGIKQFSACENLRSLCLVDTPRLTAAVATRGGYALLYDVEAQRAVQVVPIHETVNSVAISPDGSLLAVGTGAYSLSGDRPAASVELWSLEGNEPERLGLVALPGGCVDALAWSVYGDQLAAASGMPNQSQGFVALIDARGFRPVSFGELPFAMVDRISFVNIENTTSHLAVAEGRTVRLLDCRDWKQAWSVEVPIAGRTGFAYDADEARLLLTDGRLVSIHDGETESQLMPMRDCTSVAVRPEGGYVGVSSRGRLCSWE